MSACHSHTRWCFASGRWRRDHAGEGGYHALARVFRIGYRTLVSFHPIVRQAFSR
jgi:hypothetical protein